MCHLVVQNVLEAWNLIDSYQVGEVVVDGDLYTEDLVVLPDRVLPNWHRENGHLLHLGDLREALDEMPEVLIIGTGDNQCMRVAEEVTAHARAAEIELLVYDTRDACRTFNALIGRRRAVAALHLTC